MTVQLVRRTAKEFAGVFYEQSERSAAFRRAYPTLKHFLTGAAIARDGTVRPQTPGWHHFVDAAKHQLATMLTSPNVAERLKEEISEALIEEANRGSKAGAKTVLQTNLDKRDDQKHAYSEAVKG